MARRRSERTPDRKLSPRTPIRRAAALAAFVGVLAISAVTAVPGAASAAEDVDDVSPVVSDAGFTHPGVFNSLDSLKATRARVLAGEAPWADNFAQLASSPYVDREAPDFKTFGAAGATDPKSAACDRDERKGCVTVCGSFNKNPDVGCADQQADSRAVYGQALMYWYSGDATYAQRAIEILNAYSKHFKGSRGSNGPLMTAWTAGLMVRGAELIRYTYQPESSEQKFDVDAFESLLREAFVPTLTSFDYGRFNGNWKLSAAEGLISVAVFLDDRRLYNQAVAMWRERTHAYIYLSTDGSLPAPPANDAGQYQSPTALRCQWLDNKAKACQASPASDPGVRFQNGQAQESCRDFGHTSMGLGGIINTAETAWIQGEDLYGEEQDRIATGVLYAIQVAQTYESRGWPAGFCANATELSSNLSLSELPVDTVYNAYVIRKGERMPAISIPGYAAPTVADDPTKALIDANRADHGYAGNVTAWEGLTHHLASVPPTSPPSSPVPQSLPHSADDPTAKSDEAGGMAPLGTATSVFAALGVIATALVLGFAGRRVLSRRKQQ